MNTHMDRRTTFNTNPQTYQKIRPKYPEALFDELVKVTQLRDSAQLLEIGPGTGQATEPLAKRGYIVTAIELGKDLAQEAHDVLKDYKNVRILTGAFEKVELPAASFDLVYSATAFHWIKPEVQFTKPHRLLKLNGYLAIIHTNRVSDEKGDAYFFATQPIYKKYNPSDDENFRLPLIKDLKPAKIDEGFLHQYFLKSFRLSFDILPMSMLNS